MKGGVRHFIGERHEAGAPACWRCIFSRVRSIRRFHRCSGTRPSVPAMVITVAGVQRFADTRALPSRLPGTARPLAGFNRADSASSPDEVQRPAGTFHLSQKPLRYIGNIIGRCDRAFPPGSIPSNPPVRRCLAGRFSMACVLRTLRTAAGCCSRSNGGAFQPVPPSSVLKSCFVGSPSRLAYRPLQRIDVTFGSINIGARVNG